MQKSMFNLRRLVRLVRLSAFIGGLSISIPAMQPGSVLAQSPTLEDQDQEDRIDVQWGKAWETMIQGKGNRWNLEQAVLDRSPLVERLPLAIQPDARALAIDRSGFGPQRMGDQGSDARIAQTDSGERDSRPSR